MSKLALACELSLNDWLATFPEKIPKAECSKKHERWKKTLFNKMRDDHYHRFTTKTIKIMLVAAVLFALLLTAFVIPSSRKAILDKFDIYSTYQISEHNNNSVNSDMKIGYIPEGFELTDIIKQDKHVYHQYESQNQQVFLVYKSSSSMKVEYNSEDAPSEEMVIDNISYIYCEGKHGSNNLIWTKNDYVYRIDGTLSKEEMLKIAKSVE